MFYHPLFIHKRRMAGYLRYKFGGFNEIYPQRAVQKQGQLNAPIANQLANQKGAAILSFPSYQPPSAAKPSAAISGLPQAKPQAKPIRAKAKKSGHQNG